MKGTIHDLALNDIPNNSRIHIIFKCTWHVHQQRTLFIQSMFSHHNATKKKISNHKISKDFLNRDQKDITQATWTEKIAVLKCLIKHCHIELFLSKEYKTK